MASLKQPMFLLILAAVITGIDGTLPQKDPYDLQPANTILGLYLHMKAINQAEANYLKLKGEAVLQFEVCKEVMDHLEPPKSPKIFWVSECFINSLITTSDTFIVQMELVIPQYILYVNDVYNNDEDFIKLICQNLEYKREKMRWEIKVTNAIIKKLGQVYSGFIMSGNLAESNKSDFSRSPTFLRNLRREACTQILSEIVYGNSTIEPGLKSCWTNVYDQDYSLLVEVFIYFDWYYFYDRNLFKGRTTLELLFDDAQKRGRSKYGPEIITVDYVKLDYVDDGIPLNFTGKLLSGGHLASWTEQFRYALSLKYTNYSLGINTQLRSQIISGNPKLEEIYKRTRLVKLLPTSDGVEAWGKVILSKFFLDKSSYRSVDLVSIVIEALNEGRKTIPDTYITDITFGGSPKTKHLSHIWLVILTCITIIWSHC